MALSSLAQRVATAVVLVPLVLAALFLLPPAGWSLVSLAIVLAAAGEWARLVGWKGSGAAAFVVATLALASGLLYAGWPLAAGWPSGILLPLCGVSAAFWFLVAPAWLVTNASTRHSVVMALVGWIVLLGVWVALTDLQARSPWLVLGAMAVVWIADTAAYFAGRAFGRRKLAPAISPGKTWEGVWGALAAVLTYACVLVPLGPAAGYTGPHGALAFALWLLLALALVAVSIVGDLFESLLKRHAGVKDSGHLLPGHGGVLDRVDALLAAMPPAAIASYLFIAAPGTH